MKKSFLTVLIILLALAANCQTNKPSEKFNFDFEDLDNGTPVGWNNFGDSNYNLTLDSTIVKSGKYSASIEFKEGDPGFKAWAFTIPNNYAGKKITLSGYIKTENVTEGYAGLGIRIDPSIAYDYMEENGVKGTTDWTEYKISLDMNPDITEQIVVGGLLTGKGKMWIDDLSVTVNGNDIDQLKPYERKPLAADMDKEFDVSSKINTLTLSKNQIDDINVLGLIWGFLKYYHPNITKGEYNWDYELFRILPTVLNIENAKNRDEVFVEWINSLGEFPEGKELKSEASEIKLKPDLDWITTSNFSNDLSSLLLKVKNSDKPKVHYYIGLQIGAGRLVFKNEKAYAAMKYPDAGYRLLALFRYWNIIQYYFPYKNLIEEDWKNVLIEFIPKLVNAQNEKEYTLAVLELIARVHDTHANIWSKNQILKRHFGEKYAPVEITFIENQAVVSGYYDEKLGPETGLEIGDILTRVNNRSIDTIVKEKLKYSPASNYSTKLRNIAPNILRTNYFQINIEFIRDNKKRTESLRSYSSNEINLYSKYQVKDTSFKLINKDIAYINNGSIKKDTLPIIWKEIQNTKGLIIDNRNYPSDFPIQELSNYLMPKSTAFVKFSKGSIENPGLFTFTEASNVGIENNNYYKGKVVILVNEITQSSAEYHAMAYRVHPNSVVLGSTTAGADGDIAKFYLPGGISTMISGIGVYYPDGKETQRIGIVPDIQCKPTLNGIKTGKDELLEKAIEIINGQ